MPQAELDTVVDQIFTFVDVSYQFFDPKHYHETSELYSQSSYDETFLNPQFQILKSKLVQQWDYFF